ncbi:MAG: hypothetical protein K5669_04115 [Lachnospiraceae bacterium]|nr:hypothetical protein [Lachnospiraceae bacterium]
MNIFKKLALLFSKKNNEDSDDGFLQGRNGVNLSNPEDRSRYFMDCLDQMEESSREVELLAGEYQLVTDYLTDADEIDELPPEKKTEIEAVANQLTAYSAEIQKYRDRKSRMTDIEYYTLKKREQEVEEGIAKIREAEKYGIAVKRDLRRLDGERQARLYRKSENQKNMSNYKGMAYIFISAYIFCMLLLLFFQFALDLNVFIGYFLATALVAIAAAVTAIKYMDAVKESKQIQVEINKLISLQNTVKIRYVNNRKLLEYLYVKYHVENGEKLEKLWKAYQLEKEERRQFTEAQAQSEYFQKHLVELLSGYRVKYPDRWLYQIEALKDQREMVEIRHELIIRRQRVREQIDYNKKLAEDAKQEIEDIAKLYPEYAGEIIELLNSKEA